MDKINYVKCEWNYIILMEFTNSLKYSGYNAS